MSGAAAFERSRAFARTLGWVSAEELDALGQKRIAIAGLGGVGGVHLMTLARLGVGAFHIADLDAFELSNLNRQVGASMSTLGRPKVEVMAERARDVSPELDLRLFDDGVSEANVDAFLEDVDLYVDGLDVFAMEARRLVFSRCHALGIPALTAGPIGMGVAMMSFLPGSTSFEDYFHFGERSLEQQLVRFFVGLAPSVLQRGSLVDPSAMNLLERRTPSTPMGMQLCAGAAGTEAMKILLGRDGVRPAPWSLHFDAYSGRLRRTWRPWGNRNPLQRIILYFAERQLLPRLPPA